MTTNSFKRCPLAGLTRVGREVLDVLGRSPESRGFLTSSIARRVRSTRHDDRVRMTLEHLSDKGWAEFTQCGWRLTKKGVQMRDRLMEKQGEAIAA